MKEKIEKEQKLKNLEEEIYKVRKSKFEETDNLKKMLLDKQKLVKKTSLLSEQNSVLKQEKTTSDQKTKIAYDTLLEFKGQYTKLEEEKI